MSKSGIPNSSLGFINSPGAVVSLKPRPGNPFPLEGADGSSVRVGSMIQSDYNILGPLVNDGGLVFPYTPTLLFSFSSSS